jgi:acetyl esterase/lipase
VPSAEIELIRELIEAQAPSRGAPLAERRLRYDRAELAFGRHDAPGEIVDAAGCRAEWVRAQRDPAQTVVLYIHGGGYSLGSTRSHRHLAAAIGAAADAAVLSLDYRRAPEFRFPAAVEDAIAAARWLGAHTRGPIVLAGDSAGGGLVLATLVAIRDADARLPSAGVCLSPWLDLTCSADSHSRLAERDPLLSETELRRLAAAYLDVADACQPLASPVFAELAGLPPLLIQVGTEEILLDDARALARRAHTAGVQVTLQEWAEMIHVWQWYFPVLAEGRQAIASVAAFIREHAAHGQRQLPSTARRGAAASLAQQAHLLIAPSTAGNGFLSWVYQLNGRLDAQALARAVDEVARRHDILRVRFERHAGQLYQTVTPFSSGTLVLMDLSDHAKQQGLCLATADVQRTYDTLSPARDPRFRATLYTLGRKTSVLAMFVAEALVDSDSGSLLAAEISRAYAEHAQTPLPAGLPRASEVSYLEHIAMHPPDPEAIARSREYWTRQTTSATDSAAWPTTVHNGDMRGSTVAFELAPSEWRRIASGARLRGVTPYVLVLTCLQIALAQVADVRQFLAHAVVSLRSQAAAGIIGNFQSLTRVDMRLDAGADLDSAPACTASAVAEAVEHAAFPAPLAGRAALATEPSGDRLPAIRFYMFASHGGPVFAGVRRRRFRLHGLPPAPLSVSCIYGPRGRQDFVFSSTTAPVKLLGRLAAALRAALFEAIVSAPASVRSDEVSAADSHGAGAIDSSRPPGWQVR